MRGLALLVLCALAAPAAAFELGFPNAAVTRTESDPAGTVRLPEAPWSPDAEPPLAEGAIRREVFRVPGAARTTLQLIAGLRDTLEEDGYQIVFTCADASCGGFDFRFQLDILGEPDMHVDLGDYRYALLRATDPTVQPHTVALLASRSRSAGFVHIISVSEPALLSEEPAEAALPTRPAVAVTATSPATGGTLIEALTQNGHAILPDLDFGTGTSELGLGPYTSLETLAEWLADNPFARIALVGHTDAIGSLEGNTALSRRRAAAVARYLVTELGADGTRITASGAGYLAPVSTNLTEEGRAANRRVEVVLLSLN